MTVVSSIQRNKRLVAVVAASVTVGSADVAALGATFFRLLLKELLLQCLKLRSMTFNPP